MPWLLRSCRRDSMLLCFNNFITHDFVTKPMDLYETFLLPHETNSLSDYYFFWFSWKTEHTEKVKFIKHMDVTLYPWSKWAFDHSSLFNINQTKLWFQIQSYIASFFRFMQSPSICNYNLRDSGSKDWCWRCCIYMCGRRILNLD